MPPLQKKSINQARLENRKYEQIVTHLEREIELNSLEYPDETQMNTVTHKQKLKATQIMLEIPTVTQRTITPTITKLTKNLELSTLLGRQVAKRTTPQRHVTLEPMQQTGHFPGRTNLKNRTHKTVKLVMSRLQPNILTRNAIFPLRNSD